MHTKTCIRKERLNIRILFHEYNFKGRILKQKLLGSYEHKMHQLKEEKFEYGHSCMNK